jgi:hypothetical protein
VSTVSAVQLAGAVLAVGVLLATIISRLLPFGAWRRRSEEFGIILGCAAPALALLGPYLRHRLWPGAALIAFAYGGFYLIRTRQLRRANRDTVRRLLGLHKDSTYGEVLQQVEQIEPRPVTPQGQLVLSLAAAVLLGAGIAIGEFTTAAIALLLGVADSTVRAGYRRALARKVRSIGH